MRVGIYYHTSDEFLSGVEYYTLGLINALLEKGGGNRYVIFTNDPSSVARNVKLGAAGLEICPVREGGVRALRVAWEQAFLGAAARRRVDLLHCPCYVGPLRAKGLPVVLTVHDTIAMDYPSWCRSSNAAYYRMFMGPSIRRAGAVIAVSDQTAQDIARNFGPLSAPLTVIPPGIDEIFFNPMQPDAEAVRRKYGLPNRYLLAVGNLEPKKNLPAVLEAMDILKRSGSSNENNSPKLVLVGRRTWKSQQVLEDIRGRVRTGDVVLPGYVDRGDLPWVYRMADALVCAAWHEGFGLPVLEAMACGIPVLCSMSGALRQTAGEAALPIDPSDPAAIAQGARRIISDAPLRGSLVERGLQQAQKFRWRQTAQKVLDVYETAAGRCEGVLAAQPTRLYGAIECDRPWPESYSSYLYGRTKRLLDIVGCLAVAPLAASAAGAIALALCLTRGLPVLLRQRRFGKDGNEFVLHKFCTLRDCPNGGNYATEQQLRRHYGPFGGFLRKRGLDELPQLLTVLSGRMSLVGPRPERSEIASAYTARQRRRLAARPGLTGIWQIFSPRRGPLHQDMKYDLYYLRKASLLLDLKIIAMTALRVLIPALPSRRKR